MKKNSGRYACWDYSCADNGNGNTDRKYDEGITVRGHTAYVVRSDGRLYEVDMNKGKSSVQE